MIPRRLIRKLNSKSGFTLTETLSTLVIMSMVGIMVTAGVVTAVRVYRQVTEYANAQVLLSNTITLLNDKLVYANPESVKVSGKTISFENMQNDEFENIQIRKMEISFEEEAGGAQKGLYVSYVKSEGEHGTKTTPELLVPYSINEDINVYTDWTIDPPESETDGSRTLTLYVYIRSASDDSVVIGPIKYKIQTLNSKM